MDRRTLIANGMWIAAGLVLGGCEHVKGDDEPEPPSWINRDWDWLDDDGRDKSDLRHDRDRGRERNRARG